jgi:hypothetical protein
MANLAMWMSIQTLGGYAVLILVFLFGLVVLFAMATGKMDISTLLGEDNGGASMSRFQLLVFTFVIAFSLFILVSQGNKFPDVPSGVLTLLGISASTYGVSKGIQASGGLKGKQPPAKPPENEHE